MRSRSGFSLVELILFIGMLSVMAGAIVGFSVYSDTTRNRDLMISEVNQNGAYIIDWITQAIRNADYIAVPAAGGNSGEAILLVDKTSVNNTLIDLYGERIRIIENATESFLLTTKQVGIENLRFYHFGDIGDGEGVSFFFRVYNHAVGTKMPEKVHSKLFRTTVSVPAAECAVDGDCVVAPLDTCCDGQCLSVCTECDEDADCSGGTPNCCSGVCEAATCDTECNIDADCTTEGEYCCFSNIGAGEKMCRVRAACKCATVNDCPNSAPYCEATACKYTIGICDAGTCDTTTFETCASCSTCGDNFIDIALDEECDDGNHIVTDDCPDGLGGTCKDAECGDEFLWDGTEDCDDGNTVDGDGCSSTCQVEGMCGTGQEECSPPATATCGVNCQWTYCGDGILQAANGEGESEECDFNAVTSDCAASELCNTSCVCVPADCCGNGIVDGSDICDDGMRCTDTGNPCASDSDCSAGTCKGFGGDGCVTALASCVACLVDETPEVTCSDNKDNDCDGNKDCADTTDCTDTTSCGANGKQCSGGACVCPGGEDPETTCNDSSDNDCDGLVDCADTTDCPEDTVCDTGKTCQSGSCQNEPVEICDNGADDGDIDSDIDCADSECPDTTSCGTNGKQCSGGACACPGGEDPETTCNDSSDNDCDGLTDCADTTDCPDTTSCGTNGKQCSGGACACPGGEDPEVSCSDGQDNDCDGDMDGADSDCSGSAEICDNELDDEAVPDGLIDCKDIAECPDATACYNGGVCQGTFCCGDSACDLGEECAADCIDEVHCGDTADNDEDGCEDTVDDYCGGTEASFCSDDSDNDCDGLVDCADTTDCPDTTSCGTNGKQCSGGACACPGGEDPETTCNDSSDNDCDGLVDCADITDCPTSTACAGGGACKNGYCCGDSVTEAPETCDDGDALNTDNCPDGAGGTCVIATCGDTFICSAGECTTGPGGGPEECEADGDCNVGAGETCVSCGCVVASSHCTDDGDICCDGGCVGGSGDGSCDGTFVCCDSAASCSMGFCPMSLGLCSQEDGNCPPAADAGCQNGTCYDSMFGTYGCCICP